MIEQNKPKYGGEVVCAMEDGICCPAYCCDIMSTVHGLQKPMNMSFRTSQVGGAALYIYGGIDRMHPLTQSQLHTHTRI